MSCHLMHFVGCHIGTAGLVSAAYLLGHDQGQPGNDGIDTTSESRSPRVCVCAPLSAAEGRAAVEDGLGGRAAQRRSPSGAPGRWEEGFLPFPPGGKGQPGPRSQVPRCPWQLDLGPARPWRREAVSVTGRNTGLGRVWLCRGLESLGNFQSLTFLLLCRDELASPGLVAVTSIPLEKQSR